MQIGRFKHCVTCIQGVKIGTQKYNPYDIESILSYAQLLVNSTLREHIDVDEIDDIRVRKGSFGNALEEHYFGYMPNSDQAPDFTEVSVELKSTSLKRNKNNSISSKERLVITMIDYFKLPEETWETSSIRSKAEDMILVSYLYEKEKDPLDYEIKIVQRWGLPESDMPIFKEDWEIIVDKVKAGKAHEISGSDTLYLEACTKAANSSIRTKQPFSDIPAKPRAWALKQSYMTTVSNKMLGQMESIVRKRGEKKISLFDLVHKRFEPYFGLTAEEISEKLGYGAHKTPKNFAALMTKRLLGVDEKSKIAEFEKAGITTKTVRLKRNGRPKESISFPYFKYIELEETEFEDSEFRAHLDKKFLFVIYREDEKTDGVFRLADIVFWQMNDEDLEEARACYDEMRKRVIDGRPEDSVKSTENRCCHVRPHARNRFDTDTTSYGREVIKKCFWLNANYIGEEIKRLTS